MCVGWGEGGGRGFKTCQTLIIGEIMVQRGKTRMKERERERDTERQTDRQ